MSAIGALYSESRDGPVGAGSGRGPRPGAPGRGRSQVLAGRAGAARGLATGHYLSRGPGPRAAGPRRRPDGSREARGRLRPGRRAQSRPMCHVQCPMSIVHVPCQNDNIFFVHRFQRFVHLLIFGVLCSQFAMFITLGVKSRRLDILNTLIGRQGH